MNEVLDWLAADGGSHPAFPDFKRHIRYHSFDRTGASDAWYWFRQGWEAKQISLEES